MNAWRCSYGGQKKPGKLKDKRIQYNPFLRLFLFFFSLKKNFLRGKVEGFLVVIFVFLGISP